MVFYSFFFFRINKIEIFFHLSRTDAGLARVVALFSLARARRALNRSFYCIVRERAAGWSRCCRGSPSQVFSSVQLPTSRTTDRLLFLSSDVGFILRALRWMDRYSINFCFAQHLDAVYLVLFLFEKELERY
jgi:hypothetical protein